MAKMYADMIKKGTWTLDKVPAKWRAEVEALLSK